MTDATNEELNNLESLHHYYHSIINYMPNLVYVLDKNCMIVDCNQNFLDLLQLERLEDLPGTVYSQLVEKSHFSEARIQKLKQDDINALLEAKPLIDVKEAPVIDANENIVYYHSSRIPLFNEQKQITGMVVILVDMTERKQMEEELGKLKERLKAHVSDTEQSHPLVFRDPKNPPKVLMIEDNAIAQKAVQALLMQLDCQVDVADSGEKATSLFKPGKYDLVFMDIGLEDGSGYIVSKKFRQMEDGSGFRVPIIALTGYEADVVKIDCNDYFMEGAITKPLTSEQARQIIEHYIYHMDIPISGLKTTKPM
ncbi:sensory box sensor histidine kinase/response regulator [Legionella quinlivanii]|uniref:Sensory box sensor histidine kinase/response regulator n=1 Tax=Legionella quinlivanii TaxID=45073 RepID=A0A0W0Y7D0_9GAMM|nr:response regulator [Legionella quinlivanii]KTD52656.1 sensory box sensor histidine kinase/response regulator [Legionella quinlivanii]SEG25328.1 CheY chemotaxis protein or a CheY-like REC (receiver) domain [Legionella quinlivanii DSM 21216]STY10336.1 sensory box sensor histidine kinase/response regulator [Legionella quinlivanii]